MKLRNSVNGNTPFEGDRTFRWQAIPANAKIVSVTAVVTPLAGVDGAFGEILSFTPGAANFGATRTVETLPNPVNLAWAEVDFHSRRTLAGVSGTFNAATLQVDVGGGTYAEINRAGAFKTPSDPPNTLFSVSGPSAPLPGLTVAKLKLTHGNTTTPDLASVRIRSVPANVSLRVGELPPFWTHVGEFMSPETTPDFAAVLQTALATAKVENGFYDLPITIHSDTIARLKIELEVDFLAEQNVLPEAVPEVALPFDASTLSTSKTAELSIEVPLNTRVVPGQTRARVRGAFAETRVAYGPTGADDPIAVVEVSPRNSQAQIVAPEKEISATAIDLLLESMTPSARLQLDIRGDFDGKPDQIPLLPTPVEFRIEQQAQKGAVWTSVPLPSEFLFAKAVGNSSRYWLLLQSLEGRAAWSIVELPNTSLTAQPAINIQATRDGGMSWQDAVPLAGTLRKQDAVPPFACLFRLRDKPKTFKMPIELQVGSDGQEVRKKLDRFEPLGRVDFAFDTELAEGINEYLDKAHASGPPETQHLVNAEFERWTKVGEQMIVRPQLAFGVNINSVAFVPDGTIAYVLDELGKDGFLLAVDVDCNQQVVEKKIALGLISPATFVIHPDGTRAYVTDGRKLQVLDLEASVPLGPPFVVISDANERNVRSLALSPDGSRLYMASLFVITQRNNRVRIVDTVKLEQQIAENKPAGDAIVMKNINDTNTEQLESPAAIAVSPDETLLYLLLNRGDNNAVVEIVRTENFTVSNTPVQVGRGASSMVLTPDGKTVVTTNSMDDNVSIIDTASRNVINVGVQDDPRVVAVSPDGKKAYVFNQGSRSFSVVDMSRRVVIETFALNEAATTPPIAVSLAISPHGDQMYLVNSVSNTLTSIQFGSRLPAEWQLTSGDVRPVCLPAPFHLVAEMLSATLTTSLSQVVPVAASTPYELSFWGIAAEPVTEVPPAMAEVLWLSNSCSLLQTDSIPIEVLSVEAPPANLPGPAGIAGIPDLGTAPLVFHRLISRNVNGEVTPLTSPEGADQAEVRFSVGTAAAARIDRVSLGATSELIANSDFQSQEGGNLTDWKVVPAVTPGFTIKAIDDGLQLRHVGAGTVELVQTVAAESGKRFTFEFQGKLVANSSTEKPRAELRWLKADGSVSGEPTVIEIKAAGLDTTTAGGTVPAGANKVEIRIVVTPKATIEVKRISLRYPRTTTVPVKFIAEAPGDLTVSDVRVAFEEVAPKAPGIPSHGLCQTTPPGCEPGERTASDSCFCHHCEEETLMIDMHAVITEEGRPATIGRCSSCETELVSAGGPLTHDDEPLPLRQTLGSQRAVVQQAMVKSASVSESPHSHVSGKIVQLTDVSGIGESRARQLTEIGIDSVEKLAAADPSEVAKIKFITARMAAQIVADAKSLIE